MFLNCMGGAYFRLCCSKRYLIVGLIGEALMEKAAVYWKFRLGKQFFVGVLLLPIALCLSAGSSIAQTTKIVETGILSNFGDASSTNPTLSADGQTVAFSSVASNLVAGDTNGRSDVFKFDLQTGETTRLSMSSNGAQGNGDSFSPMLSADGQKIAFTSRASSLVPGDTNRESDIFVRNLQTGETIRASVASDGAQANGESFYPALSGDGRKVVFRSAADNLVADDTNDAPDVFVHDLQTRETVRVSVASDGTQANTSQFRTSLQATLSADGEKVAFHSYADNLVASDTNNQPDVFVHDLQTGETIRVSVANNGAQADGDSLAPALSADGEKVVFSSRASNLVAGDTNSKRDIFVHDLQMGETIRVSVADDGTQTNSDSQHPVLSADGRKVAFSSGASNLISGDTNRERDIFVHDLLTGKTVRTSVASNGAQGNDGSFRPALSGDGQTVVFSSESSNLIANDTNQRFDVFVNNTISGVTLLASNADSSLRTASNRHFEQPVLSADGRTVLFISAARNLVVGDTNDELDVFVYDLPTSEIKRASVATGGVQARSLSLEAALSADGQKVAFTSRASNLVADDTNSERDIFVHDLQTLKTSRASVASDGAQGNGTSVQPALSGDGQTVAFRSEASSLVTDDVNGQADIFVHDLQTLETRRVSVAGDGVQGNGDSADPALSANGRKIVFSSIADNLVAGDTNNERDIFMHNLQTGETQRISVANNGAQGNGKSEQPSLSSDGQVVAFRSEASNLVADDTNGQADIFIHDLQTGETRRVSVAGDGSESNDDSSNPVLSAGGRVVGFISAADNLVAEDTNGRSDIFVHDLQTGETTRVSIASDGRQANNDSLDFALNADGRIVAFSTVASNLVAGDWNGLADIFIHERALSNRFPTADAGADQTLVLGTEATLSGSVSDDSLPNPPGALTTIWTQTDGPASVTFADRSALNTTASFPQSGVYELRLTADDGELSASDVLVVTVEPATVEELLFESGFE